MIHQHAGETREEHERRRLRLAKRQADLAYFQARLGLIGEPRTLNQVAQQRCFKVLYQQLAAARGHVPGSLESGRRSG